MSTWVSALSELAFVTGRSALFIATRQDTARVKHSPRRATTIQLVGDKSRLRPKSACQGFCCDIADCAVTVIPAPCYTKAPGSPKFDSLPDYAVVKTFAIRTLGVVLFRATFGAAQDVIPLHPGPAPGSAQENYPEKEYLPKVWNTEIVSTLTHNRGDCNSLATKRLAQSCFSRAREESPG